MPSVIIRLPLPYLLAFTLAVACLLPSTALAQETAAPPPDRLPIGRFAADLRASMPRFNADQTTAQGIGVTAENLPTRGLGLVFGAHVYPARMGRVTLGLGAEVMRSRASKTLEAPEDDEPDGPTVETRFSGIAPQVSLNFGARDGWSYLSGGLGWSRYSVEEALETTAGSDTDEEPRRVTINYGAGARWFATRHVAVSIDLRFYSMGEQAAAVGRPAAPSMRLMVFSGGLAFK